MSSIRGARLKKGAKAWSAPFLLADTPGYPDTNATMFIDPQQRLWLLWPTILANEWHTALMKYRISSDYQRDGPPTWDVERGPARHARRRVQDDRRSRARSPDRRPTTLDDRRRQYVEKLRSDAGDKLTRRLGWMTRAHPYVLDGTRLIVPLYSDGFSFSLMAITDDWGATWKTSTPLVGFGNIQPSLARKKDGTLVAYMRDNGPAPKRLHISRSSDRGDTWSAVEDSTLPNPGAGAEVRVLANGHWVLVYNDLEQGRYSLAVSISEDEGATWPWTRHLERDASQRRIRSSAASITIRRSFRRATARCTPPTAISFRRRRRRRTTRAALIRKAIKHAHFNEAWVRAGSR